MTALLIGSTLLAAATVAAAWWFTPLSVDGSEDLSVAPSERRRLITLRKSALVYRWFEPLVQWLADMNRRYLGRQVALLERPLQVLGLDTWRPEEFLAARQIEGLLLGGVVALVASQFVGLGAVLLAAVGGAVFRPLMAVRSVQKEAKAYLQRIRSRLPYALDLMALMLEAGAGTLGECLRQAAEEDPGHPLGQEFQRVLTALDQGAALADVLQEMDQRLDDLDVRELVRTVNVAAERGTPLRQALRNLAERMQERYVQRMEKSAEEAKVHITWPALVVMGACLLIVVTPMVLSALESWK